MILLREVYIHIFWFVPYAQPSSAGRIWWFSFYMGSKGRWVAGYGLSSPNLPASPCASLLLETGNGEPGRETRVFKRVGTKFTETLVWEG